MGEANAQIFEIHMMMVEDEDYNEAISEMINTQNVNAEYTLYDDDGFSTDYDIEKNVNII